MHCTQMSHNHLNDYIYLTMLDSQKKVWKDVEWRSSANFALVGYLSDREPKVMINKKHKV